MHAGFLCGQAVINVLTIIMSRSKSKNVEIVPGFGEDCEPVTLLSMANRRTSAQWGLREMQPEEKIAIYNRKKSADGHLKMLNVSQFVQTDSAIVLCMLIAPTCT